MYLLALTSAHVLSSELAPPPSNVQDLKICLSLGASPFTRYLIVYLHIGEAVILVVTI